MRDARVASQFFVVLSNFVGCFTDFFKNFYFKKF